MPTGVDEQRYRSGTPLPPETAQRIWKEPLPDQYQASRRTHAGPLALLPPAGAVMI